MSNLQRNHKNRIDFNCFTYYRVFITKHPEIKITQKLHTKIIKLFMLKIADKIINNMFRFNFTGIGLFYIIKNFPKIIRKEDGNLKVLAPVDWKATRELRKKLGDDTRKVLYLNNHTEGYIYKFKWNPDNIPLVNKSFYSFIASDEIRRRLKNSIISSDKPLNAYSL